MPNRYGSVAMYNPMLAQVAYDFIMEPESQFLGLKLFPLFKTPLQSAQYTTVPPQAFMRVHETLRAPRAAFPRTNWEVESRQYTTRERGIEELYDDVEAALYQDRLDIADVATRRATRIMLRSQEKRAAELVMNPSNAVDTLAVIAPWNAPATADPKKDVSAAKRAVREKTGLPTRDWSLVMSHDVFENLVNCDKIPKDIQGANSQNLLMNGVDELRRILATFLGVKEILVGELMTDVSKKPKHSELVDIWTTDYIALTRLSSGGADLEEPSLGRTFMWTEMSKNPINVETYRDESHRSNVVRVSNYLDEVITFHGALFLLTGVTA